MFDGFRKSILLTAIKKKDSSFPLPNSFCSFRKRKAVNLNWTGSELGSEEFFHMHSTRHAQGALLILGIRVAPRSQKSAFWPKWANQGPSQVNWEHLHWHHWPLTHTKAGGRQSSSWHLLTIYTFNKHSGTKSYQSLKQK